MSKRKTAQRGPQLKRPPESKRRWLVILKSNDRPMLGGDEGVTTEAKAKRLSDGYLAETYVVRHDIYHGLPDPDAEDAK